jgi:hypothetical protein
MAEQLEDLYVESAGQRYKIATRDDFIAFRHRVTETEEWKEKYNTEACKVWTKHSDPNAPGGGLNIVKVNCFYKAVDPSSMYDALHDPQFRKSWDSNMIEGFNLVQLDARNDIGYYAAKFPFPMANRDFLNLRSWMEFDNGEYIIMNHSVQHADCPEKKGFVRGYSHITGYYLRPWNGTGTELLYLTHSDIKGSIPHMVLNSATQRMAPTLMDTLGKNGATYIQWAKDNHPAGFRAPWRTPKLSWEEPPKVQPVSLVGSSSSAAAAAAGAAATDGAASASTSVKTPAARNEQADQMQVELDQLRAQLAAAQRRGPADMSLAPVAPRNSDDPKAVQQYRALMQAACAFVDSQFVEEGRVPTLEEYLCRLRSILDGMRRTTADEQH